MSQFAGREGFTSHNRPTGSASHVSSLTSPGSTSRPQQQQHHQQQRQQQHHQHHQQQHSPQSAFSNQLIPRDYLSSISRARANGASTTPTPPPVVSASPSPSEPSQSLGLLDRSVLRDDSDESDDDVVEQAHTARPTQPPEPAVSVERTRPTLGSGPVPAVDGRSNPFPESSRSGTAPSNPRPPIPNGMPRTSSIDSAISNMSNSSWPQRSTNEVREPTTAEIRNLIATAGGAENLVQHLLRDKAHAASQNQQLWKLVDKQRALLLGLNSDLQKATKDRDKFRKKVKELQTGPLPDQSAHSQTPPSSARNVGESVSAQGIAAPHTESEWSEGLRPEVNGTASSPVDPGMMPSPLHLQHYEMTQREDGAAVAAQGTPSPPQGRQNLPRLASLATELAAPAVNLTEATPVAESPARSFGHNRRKAPKSLELKHSNNQNPVANEEVLEDSDVEVEALDRGRRKTREDDDREREAIAVKEQEARSRSLKEKRSKEKLKREQDSQAVPQSPPIDAQFPQPQLSNKDYLAAPLPGGLTVFSSPSHDGHSSLSPPLRSPGLPVSPRPMDRPLGSPLPPHMADQQQSLNSLPLSPRNAGFVLSPRAPKQPLPANVNPGTIPQPKQNEAVQSELQREPERLHVDNAMNTADVPPVYRGLVSPTYPDLLLPPNAIPSIQVKVASSRLKPSRFSVLGLKPQEDTSVFSLSIFSRSNNAELWRIEKIPAALPHIDQQLRQRTPNVPKLPDRKLFSGHAPATVDARRTAIEAYFEELLDTHVDEQSAVLICKFLSTDVLEPPADQAKKSQVHKAQPSVQVDAQGRLMKIGYLTKKGKNFGGWKSRYFVLDSPDLRYFEAPGGAHLGTIKLLGARIGRQTSEIPNDQIEDDGQFRHAFLILEPKRKDSTSYVRHVLCAEDDAERDEWVQALLHYVEERPSDPRPTTASAAPDVSGSAMNPRQYLRGTDYADGSAEATAKASSPTLGPSGSPSPTSPTSANAEQLNHPTHFNAAIAQRHVKQPAPAAPPSREQKIKNLFQFKQKSSQEHLNAHGAGQAYKVQGQNDFIRPVFGLSLTEAVEMCPPENINVLLPAVVYRCIEYLRGKKAANEEGLFRLSGSTNVIRMLKERFNTEGDVDLLHDDEYYDVHAVASLFKSYLRELPSTILTRDLHLEFLSVLELDDKQNKIIAFNHLVHRLPDVNFVLLRTLSEFLLEVVQNSDRNKMTVKNVGIVFSPTLNIPAPVFSMFLTDFAAIFDQKEDEPIQQTLLAPPRASNDDDVRSPRHQIFSDLPTTPYNNANFQQNSQHAPSYNQQQHQHNPGYQSEATGEFGMSPVQHQGQSYESRQYVSIPHQRPPPQQQNVPPQPMYPPPAPDQARQMQYRMMAPEGATEKAKRRESTMFFG